MHETSEDLAALAQLLDQSYAAAGPHLQRIITPARRVGAQELVQRLTGVCLIVLATVTADGRPLAGPVDGVFYRGAFHFGSAPDSVRMRHIRARPQVSATHLPGEELSVTVHGQAVPVDIRAPTGSAFRAALLELYAPRYGADFEQFMEGNGDPAQAPVYARIEARRMFTFQMEADG